MSADLLENYRFLARYNRWFNERLYAAAEPLGDEERQREPQRSADHRPEALVPADPAPAHGEHRRAEHQRDAQQDAAGDRAATANGPQRGRPDRSAGATQETVMHALLGTH